MERIAIMVRRETEVDLVDGHGDMPGTKAHLYAEADGKAVESSVSADTNV